jgi:hypothetical protein
LGFVVPLTVLVDCCSSDSMIGPIDTAQQDNEFD